MPACQTLRTQGRTSPHHQGWKVHKIVSPVGCPPSPNATITPLPMTSTLVYIGVYAKKGLSKVVRKVSVSCINPPFFGLLLYPHRGGLGRSFEHPVFQKWTSSLNIHLNIHPSKIAFFTHFCSSHSNRILRLFWYRTLSVQTWAHIKPLYALNTRV